MVKILNYIMQLLAFVVLVVTAVEDGSSEGELKKLEATEQLVSILKGIEDIPAWFKNIFVNEVVLSQLIDVIVDLLNKSGVFDHDTKAALSASK